MFVSQRYQLVKVISYFLKKIFIRWIKQVQTCKDGWSCFGYRNVLFQFLVWFVFLGGLLKAASREWFNSTNSDIFKA